MTFVGFYNIMIAKGGDTIRICRAIKIIILFLPLMILVQPVNGYTEEEKELIRVGYFLFDGYNDIYGIDQKDGYGYEYLQKIAEFTNWKYEYVPGTWQEQLAMLEKGEIDILGSAQYTDERARIFDYPNFESGMRATGIYVRQDNENFEYGEVEKLDGLTVGLKAGSDDTHVFENFCKAKNIHTKNIYFGSQQDMVVALNQGRIDAFVSDNLRNLKAEKLLMSFEPVKSYFITTKGNKHILDKLNFALAEIKKENPDYDKELFAKYYGKIDTKMHVYTKEEREYIKEHPILKVGYVVNDYPMEYFDEKDKKPKGIMIDIMDLIAEYSGIKFEYVGYKGYIDLLEGLKKEEINIASQFPNNVALVEKYQALLTKPYMHIFQTLLSIDDRPLKMDTTIAIPEDRIDLIYYIERLYPEVNIIRSRNYDDSVSRVERGEADFALQNLYMMEDIMRNRGQIKNFEKKILTDEKLLPCLAVNRENGNILPRILNKSIARISFADIDTSILGNTRIKQDSLQNFFLQCYYQGIAVTLFGVIAILITIILAKNRKVIKLQRLAETDGLSDMYNRDGIKKEINKLLRSGISYRRVLFIIDIDHFKALNDTYGHPFGDEIIQLVSKCLKEQFEGRGIFGRLGGDEFVVFLNVIEKEEDIAKEAMRLNRAFRNIQNSKSCKLTCSIGIAKFPESGYNFDTLYESADKALYYAKQQGRNTYSF